jgi:hypothetical protein
MLAVRKNNVQARVVALACLLFAAGCSMPKEDTPSSGRLAGMVSESQAAVLAVQEEQTGMFFPEGTPVQLRITFGIVLILLSVYRMIVTTMRKPDARRTEE